MRKLFVTLSLIAALPAFAADLIPLSFRGSASLKEISTGAVSKTMRLGDRTQAPFSYKVNLVLPLVNSDEKEDTRTFEQQIAANAYGKVTITALNIASFSSMSAQDQQDVLKFYSKEKIDEAKGIVSVMTLKFVR